MWEPEKQEDPIKESQRKYRQSEKGKEAHQRSRDRYCQTEKGKEAVKKAQTAYEKTEKAKARRKAYSQKPEVKARRAELERLRKARLMGENHQPE